MTRDDIIRMAREAHKALVTQDYPGHMGQLDPWTMRLLERFAALVVAAQREACAAMLDENAMACENPIYRSLLQANAQAIREMGKR
jgi:hypothetical protein